MAISAPVAIGSFVALLCLVGLGIGLGVGLPNRNKDNDSSPTEADAGALSGESGTRDFEVGGAFGPESDDYDLAPGVSPLDAFAPSRAFAPGFAPESLAPSPFTPDEAPDAAPEAAPVAAPKEAAVPVPAPAPAPTPAEVVQESAAALGGVAPGPDGKYAVCPGSWEDRDPSSPNQACGVTIKQDGTAVLGEYFGGFDGFWSVDPADGHENCFNKAVAEMFQQEFCETESTGAGPSCIEPATGSCVCFAADKENPPVQVGTWPGNQGIIKFLTDLRDEANPTDFDFPEDEEEADNGGRVKNLELTTVVFNDFITLADNC